MPTIGTEKYTAEWLALVNNLSRSDAGQLEHLIHQNQHALSDTFYQAMMQDSSASEFLSNDLVQKRLKASMQQWLTDMFQSQTTEHIQALVAQQIKIGEIHARIGVPVHLVLNGARYLKTRITQLTSHALASHASILIDLAMEIMSQAYSNSHERNSRSEEAYRLHAIAQNIAHEKDKQRAAFLDWENKVMFDCASGVDAALLQPLYSSEFGLWFRHKAEHAFAGAEEITLINDGINHIDNVLLPLLALPPYKPIPKKLQCLRELREQSKSIRYYLDLLFEQNREVESGRDVLTRLLNRKFLPAVMTKEVNYSRRNKSQFAILAIDIDHFKTVNDSYGHEGGDLVLQHLAALLSNTGRGGDYLFRLGGEEFLMLLVDINAREAALSAENIRRKVERETFLLPHNQQLQITVSIGLAMYDGHPDYQRCLRAADDALFAAKRAGRNCIITAIDKADS